MVGRETRRRFLKQALLTGGGINLSSQFAIGQPTLVVIAKDATGDLVSGAEVVLYDGKWRKVGAKSTDKKGRARWSGLTPGKYHLEVYHGEALWATREQLRLNSEGNRLNVKQETPRTTRIIVTDEKHGDADGVKEVGETLLISPKVVNDEPFPVQTRVRIFVGQSQQVQGVVRGPIEISAKGFIPSILSGKGTQWFGRKFTPTEAGQYYIRVKTETKYNGEYSVTHDTGWEEYFFGAANSITPAEFPYSNVPTLVAKSNNEEYKPLKVTVDRQSVTGSNTHKIDFEIKVQPGHILLGNPESQVLALFNENHVDVDQSSIIHDVVGQNETWNLLEGVLTVDELFTGPSPAKNLKDVVSSILQTVAASVAGGSEFEYEPVPELSSKNDVRVIRTDFSDKDTSIAEFSQYNLSFEVKVNEPTTLTIVPDIVALVDEPGHLVPKLRYRRQINVPLSTPNGDRGGPQLNSSDWAMAYGGPTRTNVTKSAGPKPPLEVSWEGPSIWASPPVVADGTVYVGSMQSGVYALDAETGRPPREGDWPFTTPNGENYSLAVADGTVYVGGGDGRIYALDSETGSLRDGWTFDVDVSGWTSELVVVDEVVYFIGYRENQPVPDSYAIYAIDATTGEELDGWPFTKATDRVSPPAVSRDSVYAGTRNGKVHAIDAERGTIRDEGSWPFEAQAQVDLEPRTVVAGDTVYVWGKGYQDTPDKLYAINAKTGELLDGWPYEGPRENTVGYPAVAGDTVYTTSGKKIYAINTQKRKVRDEWSFEIDLPDPEGYHFDGTAVPVVADDTVYFSYGRGSFYAIDAKTGAKREGWPSKPADSMTFNPIVVDEAIYTSFFEGPPLAVKSKSN